MGIYLFEMRVDVSTKEKRAAIVERTEQVIKQKGIPEVGAKLVAGPWISQEVPAIFAVFETHDLINSLGARMELYSAGLVTDLDIKPIATWEEGKTAAAKVPGYF